jgi:hypothetical protein
LGPVYEGIKKLVNLKVLSLEINDFSFYGKGKRSIPSIGDFCNGFLRIERIWLSLSKALNDEDLIRFLTMCKNKQSLECIYLESCTLKFKKTSIDRIQDSVKNVKAKILDIRLMEAGYPNLMSWLK